MRSIHLTHYKLFVFNPSQFYRIQVCICDFKHKSPFLGYRGLLCKSNGACSCAGTFDFTQLCKKPLQLLENFCANLCSDATQLF